MPGQALAIYDFAPVIHPHRVKHALCDIDPEDVHLVLHWTRLLWLYGFTDRELIVAHRSRSAQGRVHFITTGNCRVSSFVQPERVKAHDVIDPEVVRGVMPLDVVIPTVVEPLPGYREQRRVLLQDSFGLQDQRFALGLIELAIDLRQEVLELLVVPPGVILRSALAVPGI